MAEIREDQGEVNARIVYWGIPGAGISANIHSIYAKLKSSKRGELRQVPTRIDPTVSYEVLPIELGAVNGVRTRLHVIGLPGSPEQAPTRKQLLDRIDGIVFVADSRPECLEENRRSLEELRAALADYGQSPDELPFVLQYNKCDLTDPFEIEKLHKELSVPGAATFEAAATSNTGVLKTLTTISKQVVRALSRRQESGEPAPAVDVASAAAIEHQPTASTPESQVAPAPPAPTPTAPLAPSAPKTPSRSPASSGMDLMEAAILAEGEGAHESEAAGQTAFEAQNLLDETWENLSKQVKPSTGALIGADLQIVSVGTAERSGERAVRVPLVLGNDAGETVTVALTVQLDPLLDGES